MNLLLLFTTFFKIGLFSFGGGYAMIPLIQHELEAHGWLTAAQFVDIIAISEMTPGPIAVNAATFVGFRVSGFFGGLVATLGVAMPSVLLILFLSAFFFKFRTHPLQKSIFHCIRPTVTGLIAAAAISISRTALLRVPEHTPLWSAITANPFAAVDWVGLALFAVFLFLLVRWKLHPVLLIAVAAVSGILLYAGLPLLLSYIQTTW